MTRTSPPRTLTTAHQMDELWIGSIVLTFDGLAWQANTSVRGGLRWSSSQSGGVEVTSAELLSVNQGFPVTVLHDIEAIAA